MPHTLATTTLIGYHGCDTANVSGIMADNFRSSRGEDHWLGEGVYFFGKGISDPIEDAKQWAIAESWDNNRRCRFYRAYAVLQATIVAQNLLDMTQDEGKAKVNMARDAICRRVMAIGGYNDNEIVCWLARKYGFDVLVQDLYIKFSAMRKLRINSRFPNVRVICVRDPVSAIDKKSISVTYTALIP